MKKTLLILGLGAALATFGCSDDDETPAGGTGGDGGSGGMAGSGGGEGGAGGEGGEGGGPPGSGSTTTWRANTNPAGGGQVPPVTGGCQAEVENPPATIALDVAITLDASYSAGELTTGYTLVATNPILGTLGGLARFTDLSVETVITDGTPATVTNDANPAATGELIGTFINQLTDELTLATPDQILFNTEAVTSTSSPIQVNFSGIFDLVLTVLDGTLVITVDEAFCTFDEIGAPIEL